MICTSYAASFSMWLLEKVGRLIARVLSCLAPLNVMRPSPTSCEKEEMSQWAISETGGVRGEYDVDVAPINRLDRRVDSYLRAKRWPRTANCFSSGSGSRSLLLECLKSRKMMLYFLDDRSPCIIAAELEEDSPRYHKSKYLDEEHHTRQRLVLDNSS